MQQTGTRSLTDVQTNSYSRETITIVAIRSGTDGNTVSDRCSDQQLFKGNNHDSSHLQCNRREHGLRPMLRPTVIEGNQSRQQPFAVQQTGTRSLTGAQTNSYSRETFTTTAICSATGRNTVSDRCSGQQLYKRNNHDSSYLQCNRR